MYKPNSLGEKLIEKRETFLNLSIEKQVYIIIEIFKLFQKSNDGVDLDEINLSKTAGVMTINKKITGRKEIILINQSPTGLFEKEIDLLTV